MPSEMKVRKALIKNTIKVLIQLSLANTKNIFNIAFDLLSSIYCYVSASTQSFLLIVFMRCEHKTS